MPNHEKPVCRFLTPQGGCSNSGEKVEGIRRVRIPLINGDSGLRSTQQSAVVGQPWLCLLASKTDQQVYCPGFEAETVVSAVKAEEKPELFG